MPQDEAPLPFRYLAGEPSLDLVNTVDWTDDGLRCERLIDYGRLLTWVEGSGLLSPTDCGRLRRRASTHPRNAARVLAAALKLRSLIRSISIAAAGGPIDQAELEQFNLLVRRAQAHRHLEPPSGRKATGLRWDWSQETPALELPLWAAALAASNVLASPDAGRIRVCAGNNCGWMYVDRSRNGLRRWCAMDTCGGREKARRHYARVKRKRKP